MRGRPFVWNEGYVSEVDYIHGYFSELSPVRLKLALLSRGIRHAISRSPSYLELGFGQGLSLAINSATSSGRFAGTDFNPAQVANASELVAATGKQVAVLEDSFEQLVARADLPEYDIIAMHGIWSWISPASRDAIVRLASSRLRPGGILYISYNVMPGWSPVLPLRHLLDEYARRVATGPLLARVDQAIGFVERMMAADARYFTQHPELAIRLSAIRQQDRNYVSHEYFNRNWQPMSFIEVSDALAEAKLDFAASSQILDNLDGIAIQPSARALLNELGDETLRQFARDYFVNQQFRRDIFIKGARTLSAAELRQAKGEQSFMLVGNPASVPKHIQSAAGEAALVPEIYDPLVAAIAARADDPFSVDSLAGDPALCQLTREQLWEALLILNGANFIAPLSDSESPEADAAASTSLNSELCRRSVFSGSVQFLAAPRIGAAIPVSRIDQLFLLALSEECWDVVGRVHDLLAAQGERLLVDGKPVEDETQAKAMLGEFYEEFRAVRLPVLRRVGAVTVN
jgi:SAM-dependent methyltransferase